MIVEDEVRLLNSLAYQIPWESHGIEVVALASDGLEAKSIFERKKPDIIIMDILMPEEDGLSLSGKMLKQTPDTRIIILSGHDDFQYAQKALEIGVFKYLLKPAGDEEIMNAVLEAAEATRKARETRHNFEALQSRWLDHLPRLRDGFLRNWVGGNYSDAEIHRLSRELSMAVHQRRPYCTAVSEVDPLLHTENRFTKTDMPLLHFSLYCIANELFGREGCFVFQDHDGATVVIFAASESESTGAFMQRTNQSMTQLVSIARECLKVTASAGIGLAGRMGSVSVSYKQARRALQERAVLGHEIVIPYREQSNVAYTFEFSDDLEKKLLIAVEIGERSESVAEIVSIFDKQMENLNTLYAFQEYRLYVQSLLIRVIHEQGWSVSDVLDEDSVYLQSPRGIQTKEQMQDWCQSMVGKIMSYAEAERKSGTHRLIKSILALIDQSLHEDITLHTAADRLYVNSSYLSRLFKKEMGKCFSDYVLERKMKKARELLQTGLKVSDAARSTGYLDTSYFIKLFRKFWGVTPGELKK
ncbi:response regulator [Cohnella pontilimi]|nr:response regulator [Cohnella pontilimi]